MSAQDTTLPRPRPVAPPPSELALVMLSSPDSTTTRWRRLSSLGLVIGRADAPTAATWCVADPMASRAHAEIVWDQERQAFLLVDLGSRNGTQLNGEDVQREVLAPQNLVRIGDSLFWVMELDPHLDPSWHSDARSPLVGASAALQRVMLQIAKLAPSDLAVVIEGETGTGKELVARELHRLSQRRGPFVAVNCAAIVATLVESELFGHERGAFSGATADRQGVFVEAQGGTLFLDEVGELPEAAQAKLLRVLAEKTVRPVGGDKTIDVDVRVVCATNRDLRAEVDAGRFRADLFARLRQLSVKVPPLRERCPDVLPIMRRTIHTHAAAAHRDAYQVSADALEALALHSWPFNVRELIALVRRVLLELPDGGTIELAHVANDLDLRRAAPSEPAARLPPRPSGEPTQSELEQVLAHFGGRVSDAARHLGRGRTQLYRWMQRYAIDPASFR